MNTIVRTMLGMCRIVAMDTMHNHTPSLSMCMQQVLESIEYCHNQKIIHRDLKVSIRSALFELLVWPHKVEPWFHSWCRGRVETLDANI